MFCSFSNPCLRAPVNCKSEEVKPNYPHLSKVESVVIKTAAAAAAATTATTATTVTAAATEKKKLDDLSSTRNEMITEKTPVWSTRRSARFVAAVRVRTELKIVVGVFGCVAGIRSTSDRATYHNSTNFRPIYGPRSFNAVYAASAASSVEFRSTFPKM